MIVSLSSAAARGVLVAIALAAAAYLTYFSIRDARATYYTEIQSLYGYERATQLAPENARNWYLLGRYLQYSLEDANPQRAISSFRTSLELDPRATVTWLDLAATYESEGNDAGARDAFVHAKKTYPLSAEVAWRYGNFLLRQGELDTAFSEMRRSVEADRNRAAEAFTRCAKVEPDADVILDRVIPANSDIYLAVLQDLVGDRQIENALKIWKRVVALHPKLAMGDVAGLVGILRQTRETEEAHRVWMQAAALAGLADTEGVNGSAVWDGGFESGVTGHNYAWRFSNNARSVQIVFDTKEKRSGNRSLRVGFDGSLDINFRDVCQTVPVEKSVSYQLAAWMETKELTTDQGVHLELKPGTAGTAVSTADLHGTQPWTRVATVWEGAAEKQEVEVCLRRDASDQEDNKIRGTVWVDDVTLTPLDKSGRQP
jgi:tetratricopeptide (TPR) repeat protein